MSGLDRLVNQIKSEAESTVGKQLEQARQQAKDLMQQAEENAKQESVALLEEADAKAVNIVERAKSAASLQKRKKILSAKQQIIEQILQNAQVSLQTMDTQQYLELIRKMVIRYALPQHGEIIFSEQDRSRLPADLEQKLNQDISSMGASLKISSESRPIDGGFVLVYGEIEENCTFTAILNSKHDTLLDKIHQFLFA